MVQSFERARNVWVLFWVGLNFKAWTSKDTVLKFLGCYLESVNELHDLHVFLVGIC